MPYIQRDKRKPLEPVSISTPANIGDLTYQISRLMVQYVQEKGRCAQTFGEIYGAMVLADREFYRQIVAPYENGKKQASGDVYQEARP